jgi:hypothetical protein
MWPDTDRRLGEVIKHLQRDEEKEKRDKLKEQAEKHFDLTLKKLWPLKSNEKPS